jgi:hypothetical protein
MEDLVKTRLCLLPNHWEEYIFIGDSAVVAPDEKKERDGSDSPDSSSLDTATTAPPAHHTHHRSSSASAAPLPTLELPQPTLTTATSHRRKSSLPTFNLLSSSSSTATATATAPPSASSPLTTSSHPISPLSKILISDIDTIASILKMSVRDLPEPLISYSHYSYLTEITQQLESGQLERGLWEEQVNRAIGTLPEENKSTLKFLIR